jgi:hypothetical protein
MQKNLAEEATKYGLKGSMYDLLPPKKREAALKKDIVRAKEQIRLKGAKDEG